MGNTTTTMRYVLTGQDQSASSSIKGVGKQAESVSSQVGGAFSAMGNKIGGEVGELFNTLGEGIEKFGEKGKDAGPKVMAAGAAVTGLGVAFELAGSKEKQATDQLNQAITNAGGTVSDYTDQIEATVKQQENFGNSATTTKGALQILVTATGDTTRSLAEMGLVADIAAAKHISLADAATLVAKVMDGNGSKVLKQFGITLDTSITDPTQQANEALTELSQKVQGQAAASVDNFTGRLDVAKTKIEDFVGELGQKAGPVILGVGGTIEAFGIILETSMGTKAAAAAKGMLAIGDDSVSMASKVGRATAALGVLGVVVTAAVLIFDHFQHSNAAAQQQIESLTDALTQDGDAIGDNTKKLVENQLQSSGAYDQAKKYGISLGDVTNAALGNSDAQKRVNDELAKVPVHGIAAAESVVKLGNQVGGLSSSLKDAQSNIAQVTAATAQSVTVTENSGDAYDDLKYAVQLNTQALATYDQSLFATQQLQLGNKITADQFKLSILQLTDSVKQDGASLDANTEKGVAHRLSLEQLAQQALNTASDQVKAQGNTAAAYDAVAPKYAAQIKALEDGAAKAGYNKDQVHALLLAYEALPHAVTIPFSTVGWGDVFNQVRQLSNSLAAIPGVSLTSVGQKTKNARASGGPVSAGVSYLVGEKGPEILTMGSSAGHVTPNSALGGDTFNIVVTAPVGSNPQAIAAELDRVIATAKARGWRPSGKGIAN